MTSSENGSRAASIRQRLILGGSSALVLLLFILATPPGFKARIHGVFKLLSSPSLTWALTCTRATRGILGGYDDSSQKNEMEALKLQLASAQVELGQLRGASALLANDNKVLRNRLGMVEANSALSLTLCQVIKRDPFSKYYDTITVNKGQNQGLKPGCHVLSEVGFLGVVTQVSPNSADVMLATSRDFAMPCHVRSKNVTGLLMGTGIAEKGLALTTPQPKIVVNSVDGILFDKVAQGDLVTVNATPDSISNDILVGSVASLDSTLSGAPTMTITPKASFSQIGYVFVIVGTEAR